MSTWQPMETAPKDGTLILALASWGMFITEWGTGGCVDGWGVRDSCCGSYEDQKPTHWMPLPDASTKPDGLVHAGMGSDLIALCGKMLGISGIDQVLLSYVDDQVECLDCLRARCKQLREKLGK